MKTTAPHYLLLTEADVRSKSDDSTGRWRFVLEQMDGDDRIEVSDCEPDVWGERLEMLAIVRGLEALDQPSKVTLITASKYVGRRMRHGFREWKANDWKWESFGQMTPVKYCELWKRIDIAMQFHQVECRIWQWADSYRSLRGQSSPSTGEEQVELEPLATASPSEESETQFDSDRKIVFKRRSRGPRIIEPEFASTRSSSEDTEPPRTSPSATLQTAFDDRQFFQSKSNRSVNVVEIDPDRSEAVAFPRAFGCTIN